MFLFKVTLVVLGTVIPSLRSEFLDYDSPEEANLAPLAWNLQQNLPWIIDTLLGQGSGLLHWVEEDAQKLAADLENELKGEDMRDTACNSCRVGTISLSNKQIMSLSLDSGIPLEYRSWEQHLLRTTQEQEGLTRECTM